MVFTFKIIIAVDGKDCTHEIKLRALTLYNLKLKLAKYDFKQYTRDLYLGNISLNDNSKIRNLKEGATYRVQFSGLNNLYAIQLANPTLDNLERAILANFSEFCHKNARKICLRNVPLTNDSICRNIKEGGIYRVHFHKLHNCPTMCDVHLFEALPSEQYNVKSDCRIM